VRLQLCSSPPALSLFLLCFFLHGLCVFCLSVFVSVSLFLCLSCLCSLLSCLVVSFVDRSKFKVLSRTFQGFSIKVFVFSRSVAYCFRFSFLVDCVTMCNWVCFFVFLFVFLVHNCVCFEFNVCCAVVVLSAVVVVQQSRIYFVFFLNSSPFTFCYFFLPLDIFVWFYFLLFVLLLLTTAG